MNTSFPLIIQQVAERYRAMGAAVSLNPQQDDLPSALRGMDYSPDLLVTFPDRQLLVEDCFTSHARVASSATRSGTSSGCRVGVGVRNHLRGRLAGGSSAYGLVGPCDHSFSLRGCRTLDGFAAQSKSGHSHLMGALGSRSPTRVETGRRICAGAWSCHVAKSDVRARHRRKARICVLVGRACAAERARAWVYPGRIKS